MSVLGDNIKKLFFILIIIISIKFFTVGLSSAAAGKYFDNIVFIAMENQNYADVMGTGTGNSNAPFISSLLPLGSTVPNYHAFGADGRSIGGCSAGCYLAQISGSDQSLSNGWGCCINVPTIIDRIQAAGLTWQAFCESGCPRGNDHFPFTGFTSISSSPNIFAGSSVSPSDYVAAANSVSPPNFLWFTPTDSHNMHDNSISSGDAYVKSFLIGSGTLASPAPGSLLASNLFKTGHRTLFVLWWDEFDPAPILFYGFNVKPGLISSSNHYDQYSILKLIEDNWGLSALTANDAAAVEINEIYAASADFSVTASPTSGSVEQGLQNIVKIIASGPASTVTLSATGCPSSTTCTFNPTSGSSPLTSNLTIATTASTPTGTFSLTISANNGTVTRTTTYNLTVTPPLPFNFGVSTGMPSVSVNPGNSTSIVVDVNLVSGSTQSVSLSHNCPSGITCTFTPSSGNPSFSSTLGISTSSSTLVNTYTITVTGTSGSTTRTATFSLDITNSTQLSSNYTLSWEGFDWDGGGEVTLSLNGQTVAILPAANSPQNAQVFAPFSRDISSLIVSGSNTLTFQHHNFDCAVNDNVRNLQVTSGSTVVYSNSSEQTLSCTQSVSYVFTVSGTVQQFDFSISAPSTISVGKGNSTTTTIDIVPVSGSVQPVYLFVSCPSTVTCSLSPASGNPPFSSTLQITTTNSSSGNIPVTITATSGSTSKNSTVNVAVSGGFPQISEYLLWVLAGMIVLGCLAIIIKKAAGG